MKSFNLSFSFLSHQLIDQSINSSSTNKNIKTIRSDIMSWLEFNLDVLNLGTPRNLTALSINLQFYGTSLIGKIVSTLLAMVFEIQR
jgi:hypothetical protein